MTKHNKNAPTKETFSYLFGSSAIKRNAKRKRFRFIVER
jgi:hypothetical protein